MTSGELDNPRQRIRQASCNNCKRACFRHFALRFWNQTYDLEKAHVENFLFLMCSKLQKVGYLTSTAK